MGINPAMGTGYGFGGDDFYTQMLYQQMANGGAGASSWTNGGKGTNNSQTATQKQGIGLFGGAAITAGAAATGYVGMNYLNHQFNSPVEEVKGKVRFTDDFMKRFSGEYAAIQNEGALKTFYSDLSKGTAGKAAFTVDAKNYEGLMDEFKSFLEDPSNPKVADMSDDLKGFLKQRLEKEIVPSGVTIDDTNRSIYEIVDGDLPKIKEKYAEIFHKATDLELQNNYNLQKSIYESFDDVIKGMADCKTTAEKVEYLKSNAHSFGLNADEWKKVMSGVDADVDSVWSSVKANATTRKGTLKTGYEAVERNMQAFAKKWDGKAGFLGKGKFNVFSKKTGGALDNALAAMRRGKGGKYAAIAAGAAAIGCLLYNA